MKKIILSLLILLFFISSVGVTTAANSDILFLFLFFETAEYLADPGASPGTMLWATGGDAMLWETGGDSIDWS